MHDDFNCLSQVCDLQETDQGPLAGLTFVVKELLAVKNLPTTAGQPQYAAAHPAAAAHAAAVQRLLEAGARLVGKSHTHELAWGLTGINPHYGTPLNPRYPGRIPGGSSSGSACAVAAGLADLGLGTDTAGSVRVPASYCGLWGLRPTWGAVPAQGAVALAPSLDAVGLLAAGAENLRKGGRVLLDEQKAGPASALPFKNVLLLEPLPYLEPAAAQAYALAQEILLKMGLNLTSLRLPEVLDMDDLSQAAEIMRVVQAAEVLGVHEAWWASGQVDLGADVAGLRASALELTLPQVGQAISQRHFFMKNLRQLLRPDSLMLLPCAPDQAPTLQEIADPDWALHFRRRVLALSAAASLAGAPALAWPLPKLPVAMQLMAVPGADAALLDLACKLEER